MKWLYAKIEKLKDHLSESRHKTCTVFKALQKLDLLRHLRKARQSCTANCLSLVSNITQFSGTKNNPSEKI